MKKNLVKELQRLTKNLTDIETNNNNAVGVLYELNNALENAPVPLVVTFSGTSADDNASCDKTWDEIVAASELVLRYSAPHGMVTLTLVDARGDEVNPHIVGSYLMSDNPYLHLDRATFERIFVLVDSQGLRIERNFFSVSTKITPQ